MVALTDLEQDQPSPETHPSLSVWSIGCLTRKVWLCPQLQVPNTRPLSPLARNEVSPHVTSRAFYKIRCTHLQWRPTGCLAGASSISACTRPFHNGTTTLSTQVSTSARIKTASYLKLLSLCFLNKPDNETLCRTILNKQKCLFSKMEDRKVKQALSRGWYRWEGGGYKERV
jgi:hypothetical protein